MILLLPLQLLTRWLQSLLEAEEEETLLEGIEVEDTEPIEAEIIINVKLHLKLLQIQNLTKKVQDMLMGLLIQAVAAIGLKAEERPTAPTPSTAAGPPSLLPVLKIIEKLARLDYILK